MEIPASRSWNRKISGFYFTLVCLLLIIDYTLEYGEAEQIEGYTFCLSIVRIWPSKWKEFHYNPLGGPDYQFIGALRGECPVDSDNLHRLRKSRFYVMQNAGRGNWMTWNGAKKACDEVGLKLAKIDNIQTDILLGRELERFIKEKEWIDNWYWLDAKFDTEKKMYVWQDTMTALNYSNFYYRSPRPKGFGSFYDNEGTLQDPPAKEYCLSLSLPLDFPNSVTPPQPVTHGFHTSWYERECKHYKKGNAICESTEPDCEEQDRLSPFTSQTAGYYEGFWPLSNRKFVINWNAKSYEEAKTFCEANKMKIFSPGKDDTCLSQNLKNWMMRATSFSFWTDVKYNAADQTFTYEDGSPLPAHVMNYTVPGRKIKRPKRRRREAETPPMCASYTWNYEQAPINVNFCDCDFNSMVMTPENCNNPIGVICQHPDAELKKCTLEYIGMEPAPGKTFSSVLERPKMNEFVPFDEDDELDIMRSVYKQSGEFGVCPEGRRVTQHEEYWNEENFANSKYPYDYLSPYWARPIRREKPGKSSCFLSRLVWNEEEDGLERTITEEPCENWTGFILCKRVDGGLGSGDPDAEATANGRKDGGQNGLANEPVAFMEPV